MSKQITIVVGVVALLLIVIGAVLYLVLQSDGPVSLQVHIPTGPLLATSGFRGGAWRSQTESRQKGG